MAAMAVATAHLSTAFFPVFAQFLTRQIGNKKAA